MPVPEESKKRVGALIQAARKGKRWSQERLAEELADVAPDFEVTQGAVSQWEQGLTLPRRERVPVIESVLGLKAGAVNEALGIDYRYNPGVPWEVERSTKEAWDQEAVAEDLAATGADLAALSPAELAEVRGYIAAVRARNRPPE